MGREKDFGGTKAKDVSRKRRASGYPKATTSSLARVSALMEVLYSGA
jgi:hypothetical protein